MTVDLVGLQKNGLHLPAHNCKQRCRFTFLLCLLYKVSRVVLLAIFGDRLAFDLLCDLLVGFLDNLAFDVRAAPVPSDLVTDFWLLVRHAAGTVAGSLGVICMGKATQ